MLGATRKHQRRGMFLLPTCLKTLIVHHTVRLHVACFLYDCRKIAPQIVSNYCTGLFTLVNALITSQKTRPLSINFQKAKLHKNLILFNNSFIVLDFFLINTVFSSNNEVQVFFHMYFFLEETIFLERHQTQGPLGSAVFSVFLYQSGDNKKLLQTSTV